MDLSTKVSRLVGSRVTGKSLKSHRVRRSGYKCNTVASDPPPDLLLPQWVIFKLATIICSFSDSEKRIIAILYCVHFTAVVIK